jgi:hypothetical protein
MDEAVSRTDLKNPHTEKSGKSPSLLNGRSHSSLDQDDVETWLNEGGA